MIVTWFRARLRGAAGPERGESARVVPRPVVHGRFSATRLVALAEGQHGVVTHGQLLALGARRSAIESVLRRGQLRRLHVGGLRTGHTRASGRRAMAGGGPGLRLSERCSATSRRRVCGACPRCRPIRRCTSRSASGSPPTPGSSCTADALTRADITVQRGVPTSPRRRAPSSTSPPSSRIATLRAIADHGVRLDAGRSARRRPRPSAAWPGRAAPAARRRRLRAAHPLGLERRLRGSPSMPASAPPLVTHGSSATSATSPGRRSRLVVEVDGPPIHSRARRRENDHERDAELTSGRVARAALSDRPDRRSSSASRGARRPRRLRVPNGIDSRHLGPALLELDGGPGLLELGLELLGLLALDALLTAFGASSTRPWPP
jgi:hypothetical protein